MIAVADINTLWRLKPFQALSSKTAVLGVAPQDVFGAWNSHGGKNTGSPVELDFLRVTLPPGWASKFSAICAPYLWWRIKRQAHALCQSVQGLVVTSPHYLNLVKKAAPHVRTFYYCSDDYAQYANWGGDAILKKEAELTQLVDHSIFVSSLLAERAVSTYGVRATKVSVSPNATDESFFQEFSPAQEDSLFQAHPTLKRPLLGVVGAINSRLDFDLIEACCQLSSVGSVVMVGPVDPSCDDDALVRLRNHPKCIFVGSQPHQDLPLWMHALDVALVPYRDTELNRACSPMRLFDHLATGKPLVGTAVNAQMLSFAPWVRIGRSVEEICGLINAAVKDSTTSLCLQQKEAARRETWEHRAAYLQQMMQTFISHSL